jgi:hypothetical protein
MVAPIHEFDPKWIKKGRIRRRRIAPTRRIRRDKKRRIRRNVKTVIFDIINILNSRKGKGETKKKRITNRKYPKTIEKRKTEKIRASGRIGT